jgi:hypothetical protein
VKIALALTAATALAASALIGAPALAAPGAAAPAADLADLPHVTTQALKKESFTVFGKFTSRQQVKYGNAKGVGNLTVTQGTVSDAAGAKAGTLTTVMRVVAPSPKKDAELRDTQSQVQLKGGQIFAQAVNEDPKDGPPKSLHIMTVTGGTGIYASARGTLLMRPIGDKYLMAYDIFVEKDLKSTTFTFDTIVQEAYSGSGVQGIGNVYLMRATSGANSYILIATKAGQAGAVVTDTVDMQVFTPTGSVFARTIARAKSSSPRSATFAVLGGTGSYAGHRGELTLSANGSSITMKSAKPGGSSKPLTWFEDSGRNVGEATIPGGTFLGADGYMFKTANTKANKTGDYFATLLTYDEIDGVTPVVGMIEQEFKTGTMIITGITLSNGESGTAAVRPLVGGTGDYGGATGEASSLQQSQGVWKKTARFWR